MKLIQILLVLVLMMIGVSAKAELPVKRVLTLEVAKKIAGAAEGGSQEARRYRRHCRR